MNIQKQKQITDEVLEKIRKFVSPNALVAGGAPRDWSHNKEAKDIDLYFNFSHQLTACDFKEILLNIFPEISKEVVSFDYPEKMANIQFVVKMEYKGLKFDLISTIDFVDLSSVFSSFDTDLCMVAYYGHDIVSSIEFIRAKSAKKSKINTKLSGDRLKISLEKHIPRLKEKYPEYDFTF